MFCGHAIANGRDFRQTRHSVNNGLIATMILTAWTPSLQYPSVVRARISYWNDDVLIVNIIVAQSIRSGADCLRPAQFLLGVSLSTGYELVTALDIDVSFFGCSYSNYYFPVRFSLTTLLSFTKM